MLKLVFIDGNVDSYTVHSKFVLDDAIVIGAENGPSEAITEFKTYLKSSTNKTIITNCPELLKLVPFDRTIENFNIDFAVDIDQAYVFIPINKIYPILDATVDLYSLYLSDNLLKWDLANYAELHRLELIGA